MATLNGFNPSSDCLSGNSPRATSAPSLRSSVTGHAHVVHLVLDRDLDADIEALSRRDDVGGAQADRRILLAVEQRLRQQVLARSVARALRHARRKIRARLLAHGRLVDGQFVHRNTDVEPRLQWIVGDEHRCPRDDATRSHGYGRDAPWRRRDRRGSAASDSSATTWYSRAPAGAADGRGRALGRGVSAAGGLV